MWRLLLSRLSGWRLTTDNMLGWHVGGDNRALLLAWGRGPGTGGMLGTMLDVVSGAHHGSRGMGGPHRVVEGARGRVHRVGGFRS